MAASPKTCAPKVEVRNGMKKPSEKKTEASYKHKSMNINIKTY